MPLIPSEYLDCTMFIYPDEKSALADKNFLAVGFILGVESEIHSNHHHNHIVTNEHVIRDFPSVVLRYDAADGGIETVLVKKREWTVDAARDIAVLPVSGRCFTIAIGHGMCLTEADANKLKIGPGDDVFMVSRLVRERVRYKNKNVALMRFGNISMKPTAHEPDYMIELRSISGHSGSPVFVLDVPFTWPGTRAKEDKFVCKFLGMNKGHVIDYEPLVAFDPFIKKKIEHPKWLAQSNVALSQVVPGWAIVKVLNSKKLRSARKKADMAALARKVERKDFVEDV